MAHFHPFPDITKADTPKLIVEANMKGAALANCFVEPKVSVALYDVVGGTMKVRPYAIGALQADTEATPPIKYSVTYGMKGGASVWAKLPLLGKLESPEFQLIDVGGGPDQTVTGSFNLGSK
jgi:hypothetical protein